MFKRKLAALASCVYFVQGAIGISAVAFPLYLRGQGWSIKDVAVAASIANIPWFIKILYGAVSDSYPIFGLRRKPYILICSVLSMLGWALLFWIPVEFAFVVAVMFIANIGFAATDVITDGVIVENSDAESTKFYQSVSWGARSVGAIIAGVLGGYLAHRFPYKYVFIISAFLPLITLVAASFIEEPTVFEPEGKNIIQSIAKSVRLLFHNDLLWFALLLLFSSFSAAFSTPFFFYLKETLNFSETFLGVLASVSWGGAVIGCLLYLILFRKISLKTALFWSIIINFVTTVACVLVLSRISAFILFLIVGIFGYISFLPLMAASARLARGTGVEGSLFAILMSVHNLGLVLSGYVGANLFEVLGLKRLIILTASVGLFALIFLFKLKMRFETEMVPDEGTGL